MTNTCYDTLVEYFKHVHPSDRYIFINKGCSTLLFQKEWKDEISNSPRRSIGYLLYVLNYAIGGSESALFSRREQYWQGERGIIELNQLIKILIYANINNPYFPKSVWGVESLLPERSADGTFHVERTCVPSYESLTNALYIYFPTLKDKTDGSIKQITPVNKKFTRLSDISSSIDVDPDCFECERPADYKCITPECNDFQARPYPTHYKNEHGFCVPCWKYFGHVGSGSGFVPGPGSGFVPTGPGPGSGFVPTGPGLEPETVQFPKEDGSSTLLYIAGAGILGAIAYVLLRK